MEPKIKAIDNGKALGASVSRASHLGTNPVRGGSPPKDIRNKGMKTIKFKGIIGVDLFLAELRLDREKEINRGRERKI